jgi:hypothetical protein
MDGYVQHVAAGSVQLDLRPLLYEPSQDPSLSLRTPRRPPPDALGSASVMVPSSGAASTASCRASSKGYRCSVPFARGTVHYTIGGALPDNACTRAAAAAVNTRRAGNTTSQTLASSDMAHFMLEAQTTGYVSLAIGSDAGSMYPADAVIGFLDNSGAGDVRSYFIERLTVTEENERGGWAVNTAVMRGSNATVLCFSRYLYEPAANIMKTIPSAAGVTSVAARSPSRSPASSPSYGSLLNLTLAAVSNATGQGASLSPSASQPDLTSPSADSANYTFEAPPAEQGRRLLAGSSGGPACLHCLVVDGLQPQRKPRAATPPMHPLTQLLACPTPARQSWSSTTRSGPTAPAA